MGGQGSNAMKLSSLNLGPGGKRNGRGRSINCNTSSSARKKTGNEGSLSPEKGKGIWGTWSRWGGLGGILLQENGKKGGSKRGV